MYVGPTSLRAIGVGSEADTRHVDSVFGDGIGEREGVHERPGRIGGP